MEKKNITIPKESSVKIDGPNLTITGPKGTKKLTINELIAENLPGKMNEFISYWFWNRIDELDLRV